MTKRFMRMATAAGAIVAGALLFAGSAQAHQGVDELVGDLRSTSIDDVTTDHVDVLTGSETLDTDALTPGVLSTVTHATDASPAATQPTEQLDGLGGLGGLTGGLTGGTTGDQLSPFLDMASGMPLLFSEQVPVSALGGTLPGGLG